MRIEVKVPTVGESITEGILAEWKVADGAFVNADDPLFELETDKVSMTVTAEKAGRITLSAKVGSTILIGSAVAFIETDALSGGASATTGMSAVHGSTSSVALSSAAGTSSVAPPLNPPAGIETLKVNLAELAPSVRRIVTEEQLDPAQITGTGKGGRITKEDAMKAATPAIPATPPVAVTSTVAPPSPVAQTPPQVAPTSVSGEHKQPAITSHLPAGYQRTTRRPMSSLRQRIAERMVEAQHNAAILTTFNEVDMSAVMALRERYKDAFLKQYGVKLGIMSFFVKATVEALKAVPAVNAQIDGNEIIENHFYDISVAVSTERGLVTPVVRNADRLSFAELEQEIARYAEKARNRTLTLDELTGGVFTISNGGVFGSMLSTPILNPPQSAILGLHGIKKRPVAVGDDDHIEVRPMMYLAVSYDHRLIDGRESVAFLKRIVECIEGPERMLVGV